MGAVHPRLSVDSNEGNPDAASVQEYLERLQADAPDVFDKLEYLEQPTSRDILNVPQNWQGVTKLKPVILDEGLTGMELLSAVQAQGWSGIAIKTCKGHSFSLVAAAWARQNGLLVALQDLTNPGLAAIHSLLVAAHIPTLNGIELNSPQYTPDANADWLPRLQPLLAPTDGTHRLPDALPVGLWLDVVNACGEPGIFSTRQQHYKVGNAMNIIPDEETLEDLLSAPTPAVVETMRNLEGDILVLGVGGKMGPTLARMAKRASEQAGVNRRVIGVSRFGAEGLEAKLNSHDVETIRCDLLDAAALARLPDAPNIVYMAGMKFGATGNEALTWAMNSYLPGMVCQKFRHSRIAAFSTGNVYGLTPLHWGGSLETDACAPVGDYAMSCLGRERIFAHFSQTLQIPVALIRLNYAVEMRYGVLVDVAQRVWAGEPVNVGMGMANVIWQGDANAHSLLALGHCASPPFVLNVSGPETLSIRRIAEQFGQLFGKPPRFEGEEAAQALLSNAQLSHRLFGYPHVPVQQILQWTADWVQRNGPTLNKPTHFEARDGKF